MTKFLNLSEFIFLSWLLYRTVHKERLFFNDTTVPVPGTVVLLAKKMEKSIPIWHHYVGTLYTIHTVVSFCILLFISEKDLNRVLINTLSCSMKFTYLR